MEEIHKQRGIKGYYKLRKAELIHKLEAHSDVNEQVLIPELEIPRNTAKQDQSIPAQFLMIKLQYYNQHRNSLPKACKRSKIVEICCWIG